ncbi:hypothetical protein ETAA8_06030 [Anatilimnocola aggregata]|uniref:Uncharacterized protein n=1 Tax=Anatilimnocola aggregata TaxID=2528021 RepID=A0A517Y5L6_9BACT|nr:carboxypeptidase regulatory-like domain-containing protein [Anatilimnocola aggregata]QDU25534.1 hypothetical protein ETAA8_06030 [Anatilimnocola aggregata]
MNWLNPLLIAGLISYLLAAAGCGPKLESVKGRVTFAGRPVPKGHIWFVPDLEKGAEHTQFSICPLNMNGEFELATYGENGVPPGWYKIVIYATKSEPPSSPTGWTPDWIVPAKYTSDQTTDLRVEVVANPRPGMYDFDLKP